MAVLILMCGAPAPGVSNAYDSINYQGFLQKGGEPANGLWDLRLHLYDAETDGNEMAVATFEKVLVSDGLFTVDLPFAIEVRQTLTPWLGVEARPSFGIPTPPDYETLTPRMPLRAVPYAIRAETSDGPWFRSPGGVGRYTHGRVGIGLSEPTHPLTVNGDARFTNGSVGIGTDSPNAPLDVASSIPNPSIVTRGGYDYATAAGEAIDIGHWDGTDFSRRMRILPSGNVGIGTATPDTPLHVVGPDNDGTSATLKITSGEQSMFLDGNEIDSNSSVGLHLNNNTAGDVVLVRGGGRVIVGDADNVGSGVVLGVGPGTVDVDGTMILGGDLLIFGDINRLSSARFKTAIEPLRNGLDAVLQMQGVSYVMKDRPEAGRHIGFLAEDVAKVAPELVAFEEDGATVKGLDYSRVTALTVEAIKEQQAMIHELREENAELRARLDRMEHLLEHAN